MKCLTAQQHQTSQLLNENCNNTNASISSGIVDNSNIMTQINPTPILQTNHVANMNVSSPNDSHHKSPTMTSTGNSNTASSSSTTSAVCGTCLQPISDRYIMKVADSAHHEKCLQCNSCYCTLTNTCYQRDNQLYCRKDYERWVDAHTSKIKFILKITKFAFTRKGFEIIFFISVQPFSSYQFLSFTYSNKDFSFSSLWESIEVKRCVAEKETNQPFISLLGAFLCKTL